MAKVWTSEEEMKKELRGPDGYLYLVKAKNSQLNQGLVQEIIAGRPMISQENQNSNVVSWYYVDISLLIAVMEQYSIIIDFELQREDHEGKRQSWRPKKDEVRKINATREKRDQP